MKPVKLTERDLAILTEVHDNRTLTFGNLRGRFWPRATDTAARTWLKGMVGRKLLKRLHPGPSFHVRFFLTYHGANQLAAWRQAQGVAGLVRFRDAGYPQQTSEHDHRVYEFQGLIRNAPGVSILEWETDQLMKARYGAAFNRRVPDARFRIGIEGLTKDAPLILEYEHAHYSPTRIEQNVDLWLEDPWGAYHKLIVTQDAERTKTFMTKAGQYLFNRYANPFRLTPDQIGRRFSFVAWPDLVAKGFRGAPWKRLDGKTPGFVQPA